MEQEGHDRDGDDDGRDDQDQAPQQHGAERYVQQRGEGECAHAGDDEDDAALQCDGHGDGHPRRPQVTDPAGGGAGERSGDDQQHVQVDGLQQGADGEGQRVGQPLGPEQPDQPVDQFLDGAHLLQDRAHQDTEGDQETHLGHDVAEALRDRLDGLVQAEFGRQPQVEGAQHQGDHWVHMESDDQDDGGDDGHGRVDQDRDV